MKLYNRHQLIHGSYAPTSTVLGAYSVKISCLNNKTGVTNEGTGTLFHDVDDYYVITAGHCIQYEKSNNHFDKEDIHLSFPNNPTVTIKVISIEKFDPKDEIDFALIKVEIEDRTSSYIDYGNHIKFVGKDEIGQNTCIYGYTEAYPNGRLLRAHEVTPDTYTIDDKITASCKDFAHTMHGSSGGGIFVGIDDILYCVGYVKGWLTDSDKLDDITVKRFFDINDKLKRPIWIPSLLSRNFSESQIATTNTDVKQENLPSNCDSGNAIPVDSNNIEVEYSRKWDDLYSAISNKQDANKILDDIAALRIKHPYSKVVSKQENLIHKLLIKKGQWTQCEQRTFIYALLDRGLWPSLFGELPQFNREIAPEPELRGMLLRASTFACGTEDGGLALDQSQDSDIYEMILREAFKFNFDGMFDLLCKWNPTGVWVVKRTLLMNMFGKDDESLKALNEYIENKTNPISERFVAALVYNTSCQEYPHPVKYEEFWNNGIEGPSEIITFISNRIDRKKLTPKIFGVHTTTIFSSPDTISFPESLRMLQYIVNAGLTTKLGIYNVVNVEHWMKVFRHLIYYIPFPTIYYTLQYAEEKTIRWASQMIAYRDDEFINEVRPHIITSLLKSMQMEHFPKYMYQGMYYMTQELYMAVSEDIWYADFKCSILNKFVSQIPLQDVTSTDAIYKNVYAALQCIRDINRRQEVFVILISVINKNAFLISRLICGALWVDSEILASEECKTGLWSVINNFPVSQTYNMLREFGRVNALSQDMKTSIDKKIVDEELKFAQSDYPALINLSYLVQSGDGINKIKEIAIEGDMWNCGITDSHYTDPMPFHIEMFDDKIKWTEEDWQKIRANMEYNLALIEKHNVLGESANFYNCMYLNLLSDMKMFIVNLSKENKIFAEDLVIRIDEDIAHLSGFDNLLQAISSDDYNKVGVALDLLNVLLKTEDFEKHIAEIQLIITKVALMQSADLDKCINFISYLMHDYRDKMLAHFSNLLLLLLRNYSDYDFEKFNFNVPIVNHRLSLIAYRMKPDYEKSKEVRYWTSEAVLSRFGGLDTLS